MRLTNIPPASPFVFVFQDAMNYVKKAQDQEYKLYTNNTNTNTVKGSGPPPAPLLVCRTDTTMVFKPAPYNPKEKVRLITLLIDQ